MLYQVSPGRRSKENEIGRACSTMEAMRNAYRMSVETLKEIFLLSYVQTEATQWTSRTLNRTINTDFREGKADSTSEAGNICCCGNSTDFRCKKSVAGTRAYGILTGRRDIIVEQINSFRCCQHTPKLDSVKSVIIPQNSIPEVCWTTSFSSSLIL
jgi:hypothetical protein